jgi:uncharacterized protein
VEPNEPGRGVAASEGARDVSVQGYRRRTADDELDELLGELPAVALEGPKGVGKTATATQRVASIIQLDDPAQRAIAIADPQLLLGRERPILIDEWQFVPAVWDVVRRAVDVNNAPNQYLLTGSATPGSHQTHSGAGRIVTVRMRPLSLAERGIETPTVSLAALLAGGRPDLTGRTPVSLQRYTDEIVASGFPGLRGFSGRALRMHLDSYITRIVERDFEESGHRVRRPQTLRRWMAAYAAAVSETISLEKIRDAATGDEQQKPAKTTALMYREILERLWILDPVPAWLPSRNPLSRLSAMPKHHLADPALAARLLGLDAAALLTGAADRPKDYGPGSVVARDGTMLGRLFESLVTLTVRVQAQAAEANVHHLRMYDGRHEVDLVVVRGDQRVLAIEVKLGAAVQDEHVHHLHWLQSKLGDDLLDAIVVNTGPQAYRRKDGIGVVPAALLGS